MDDDTRDMDGYDEQVLPDIVCSFLVRARMIAQIGQQDTGDVDGGDYYNEDI